MDPEWLLKKEVAVRWYAFLPLLLVFLMATPTSLSDQAGDLGQATLTMHATISSHSHYDMSDDCHEDDDVTVTATSRVQYRITRIRNGVPDLEMVSHQNSFTASGGGKDSSKRPYGCTNAWTYQIIDHSPYPQGGVWVNLGTGRGGFGGIGNIIQNQELKSYPSGVGSAKLNASNALLDNTVVTTQESQAFWKQFEFSFKPYSKNISVHRSADHTYAGKNLLYPGTVDMHVDFSLVAGAEEDSEAVIIPPDNYDYWLPEAGEDESTPGNTIVVTVKLQKPGDPTKSAGKKAKFRFALSDVCLNWPPYAKCKNPPDPDLKIDRQANPTLDPASDGQSATTLRSAESATVTITSYDWGAYGHLTATAILDDDGSEITAHVQGGKKYDLTIPKDDDGNHIGDYWDRAFPKMSKDANADEDESPQGDGDKGDGLSYYEEYRGFRARGQHIRTYPYLKDIFINDSDKLGLGYFAQSRLTTHLIDADESDASGASGNQSGAANPMIINPNRGFATLGPQHGLFLVNMNIPGLYGLADGTGPGPPKTTFAVKVDKAKCLSVNEQQLESVIAHELSHACNVLHHGNMDYRISLWRRLRPDGTWGDWTERSNGSTRGVAVQGGQESGVEKCIMRYSQKSFYETATGPIQWKNDDGSWQRGADYPPMELAGTIFCDSEIGTGVNDPKLPGGGKAGNASNGKCSKQFCVNDRKH
jgi:hypothetical protein